MTRVLIAFAVLALGGCSLGTFSELPAQQVEVSDAPETYYRQLVAGSLASSVLKKDPTAQVQISTLRKSVAPQPGDWTTCLRTSTQGKEQFIAVFFRNRQIIESRSGIQIDLCEIEQYAALPPAAVLNQLEVESSDEREVVRAAEPSDPRLRGLY